MSDEKTPPSDEPAEDFGRAERALREALAQHADEVDPVGPGPVSSPPRQPWRWLAVADAVLVVAVVGALAVRQIGSSEIAGPGSSPSGSTAEPTVTGTLTVTGGLPEPMEGFQWVSSRDVAVQVPSEWDYSTAPGSDWCAGRADGFPTEPYYDSFTGPRAVLAIGCSQSLPRNQDVMHLSLSSPWGNPVDSQSWHRTRSIGGVVVTVSVPSGSAQDEALAQKILDSAITFTSDQVGCTPNSPIEKWDWVRPDQPFDVTAIAEVTSISLCQYQKSPTADADTVTRPRLLASRGLWGQEAAQLLAAIQQSPVGGGPNQPEFCSQDHHDAEAIVVRLWTAEGSHDLFAHVGNCTHNGIDDGSAVRAVTAGWCRPLFTEPLLWSSMSEAVAGLCLPASQVPQPTTSPTR